MFKAPTLSANSHLDVVISLSSCNEQHIVLQVLVVNPIPQSVYKRYSPVLCRPIASNSILSKLPKIAHDFILAADTSVL
jgi:hypothetical protein